jgi:hypothetical protein
VNVTHARNIYEIWLLQQNRIPGGQQTTDVRDRAQEYPPHREFLCCAVCLHPITRLTDRIVINERHQHVFANPHGYIFEIGCFAHAPGCVCAGELTTFFSWFPGYAWQAAHCGQCLTHLGWRFLAEDTQFFGLVLERLQLLEGEA